MHGKEVEAQDHVMRAFGKDGEYNCLATSDANMSSAHSNDGSYSTIGDMDDLSRCRCQNFPKLSAKISTHNRKLCPSVDECSDFAHCQSAHPGGSVWSGSSKEDFRLVEAMQSHL